MRRLMIAAAAALLAAPIAHASEPCNPWPECAPKRRPRPKPPRLVPMPPAEPGLVFSPPLIRPAVPPVALAPVPPEPALPPPSVLRGPPGCIVKRPPRWPADMPYPCEYDLQPPRPPTRGGVCTDAKPCGAPQPGTLALVCAGLGAAWAMRRRACA